MRTLSFLVLSSTPLFLCTELCSGQAGQLDVSFGIAGRVTISFPHIASHARSVAVQADGKIVAVGFTRKTDDPQFSDTDFALARYNTNGTLDANFGVGGVVFTDFGGSENANALILQPDGKIVAVGSTYRLVTATSFETDFALARYNPDGSLDSSFGNGGLRTTNIGGDFDQAFDVVLQPDGKIVVVGLAGSAAVTTFNVGLARYNPNGTLDVSFGNGGVVVRDLRGGRDSASSLLLQPDGKIVVAGSWEEFWDAGTSNGPTHGGLAIARFNTNGSLDVSFGVAGLVLIDSFATNANGGIAVQPDGKIVALSGSTLSAVRTLARFNPNGTLDTSFGVGGWVTTNAFQTQDNSGPVLQPDGKIIIAGKGGPGPDDRIFLVARFHSNGALDSVFGTGGFVTTSFLDLDESDDPSSVLLQPDGRIVVAGTADDKVFALARYLGAGQSGTCSYTVSPTSVHFTSAEAKTVNVTASAGCTWNITNLSANWLSASPMSSSGTGAVSLTAAANTGPARSTQITIAGTLITVTQESVCSTSVTPLSANVPATGGAGVLTIVRTGGCGNWMASSSTSWLQVYPLTSNSSTATYTVFPNFSSAIRTGQITIGSRTFNVTQSGSAGTSNERFVGQMYFNFFGRLASTPEITFHVGTLNGGLRRTDLVMNFFNSGEFNNGGRFIAGLYVGLLGRNAEYSGWLFQRNALATGVVNQLQLSGNFVNSAEWSLKFGSPSNADFIRLLYRYILLREASQAEVDLQVNAITSGIVNRTTLANAFLNSNEFRTGTGPRLTAFLLYATLLLRDPNPSELVSRIAQLESGTTVRTLVDAILASPEFAGLLN